MLSKSAEKRAFEEPTVVSQKELKELLKLFKLICLNINTDRRITGIVAEACPEYPFPQRKQGIIDAVVKILADLIILFEVSPEMIEPLIEGFALHGYHCEHVPYNESTGAFSFLVLSKNEKNLQFIKAYPLTESGSYISNSERPASPKPGEVPSAELIAYKKLILGDNFEKTVIKITIGGTDYYCTHLGLQNETRLLQTQEVRRIIEAQSQGRQFIITGDFNSFDSTKSTPTLFTEQLEIVSTLPGVTWDTSKILCTFRAYIFDLLFKMSITDKAEYFRLEKEYAALITQLQSAPEDKIEFLQLEKAYVVQQFRLHCEAMVAKYGLEGTALDHVFSSETLNVTVEVIDMGSLSDHFMMVTTIQ